MSDPAEAFNDLVGQLDYPMFIVTTSNGDELSGCLVGFATQASINPARFMVALSRKNHTFGVAQEATHLGVHLVPREEYELARLFGEETGDSVDKFNRCDWRSGPGGTPILRASPAWFVGEILQRFDLGDHVAHMIEPIEGQAEDPPSRWVSFTDVKELDPGHEA
jgi:flavin reductase (DIM6/NTAB) family NADH-FMN oxidoreductase RutF